MKSHHLQREPLVIRSHVLSYAEALASAAQRKAQTAAAKSIPHQKAAETRKANARAIVMQKIEELRA